MTKTAEKETWSTVFRVATGIVVILLVKSIIITFIWNRTMPKLIRPDERGIAFIRKINWQIALGLLLLLSLLHSRPVL